MNGLIPATDLLHTNRQLSIPNFFVHTVDLLAYARPCRCRPLLADIVCGEIKARSLS